MLNTLILGITALVTAMTPIMLAVINRRQSAETTTKVNRLEELHAQLVSTIASQAAR
jgi:hypothetical protein